MICKVYHDWRSVPIEDIGVNVDNRADFIGRLRAIALNDDDDRIWGPELIYEGRDFDAVARHYIKARND